MVTQKNNDEYTTFFLSYFFASTKTEKYIVDIEIYVSENNHDTVSRK